MANTDLYVEMETLSEAYKGATMATGEGSNFYFWASSGLMQEVAKLNEMWQGDAADLFAEKMLNEVKVFSEIAASLRELENTMKSVQSTYKKGENTVQKLVQNINV